MAQVETYFFGKQISSKIVNDSAVFKTRHGQVGLVDGELIESWEGTYEGMLQQKSSVFDFPAEYHL